MTDSPRFTTTDRPTVRVERLYPHPVDKVWRAVTSVEHLSQWFPTAVELELRPGGTVRFPAFAGQAAASGAVELVEPPRRLAFSWATDRVVFELTPEGDGTRFALTHTFDDRAGAASRASGWEGCLAGLRCVLAGEPMPPPDRAVARHEELVHEFELDRPEVTETEEAWTIRYERQLTCPAQVAWDLWFGTDATGAQRTAPGVGETLSPYLAPDLVIGTMTEVDEPRVMAFTITDAGGPGEHLRLELVEGTGHGARLVLTVSGSDPSELAAATDQWGAGAVGHLASEAARWALSDSAA